jgi:hypothetical protein
MSQSRHLIGNNGKININFIGKFENMENDLTKALNNIDIHNINHVSFKKNSKKHDNYKKYYDQYTLEKVNIIIKEDLDNFDYTRFDNIELFEKS